MTVIFSSRAYTAVLAETLSNIHTETGGVFLGKYVDGNWYIVESIDPGPNSIFQVDYFEYDQKYVHHLINKKALLYESQLELIGLWHRHPGSFNRFSSTDDITNSQYAAMREQGAISMLVNLEPEFRFTIYHVSRPCIYQQVVEYSVGDDLFPEKLLSYKDPENLVNCLNGKPNHEVMEKTVNKELKDVMNIILPELIEKYSFHPKIEIFNVLKKDDYSMRIASEVASDLLFLCDRYGIQFLPTPSVDKLIVSQDTGTAANEIVFTYNKKESTVLVTYMNNTFYYHEGLFEELIRKALENGV